MLAGTRPYRELTPISVIGGILVGAILNVGIVFAGLQIGFTIVGSTVGAILGFGLLRGILRKGSILEVNIFQTIASSVNTVNSGVIFTVPVLFLLGQEDNIDWVSMTLATVGGSILGVVLIIPLRKQIIDYERLRFPSAVAVGTILKSPGAGPQKAVLLLVGLVFAAVIATLTHDVIPNAEGDGYHALIPGVVDLGAEIGIPSGIQFSFAVNMLCIGAGFLAGRAGLAILYGTILNYWVLIPFCVATGWLPEGYEGFQFGSDDPAHAGFEGAFRNFTSNKVGIGMILGGAIAGVVLALPALRAAIASLRPAPSGGRQEEVSIKPIGIGAALGTIAVLAGVFLSGGGSISITDGILATLFGVFWLWLAGLVVAQTTGRTDWSPLSGLSLLAVAISMGILGTSDGMVIPAVTLGAAVCVATSMCADMMADFKTGYLVGGLPRSQQLAQIGTAWIGPGISLAAVLLLWNAYAFGPQQGEILRERALAEGTTVEAWEAGLDPDSGLPVGTPVLGAPQAAALESAITTIQGGDVPVGKYLTGSALGFGLSMAASPGMGVMVGLSMYMPFFYMAVFGIGGLLNILLVRMYGRRLVEDKGVPLAAGLIVGEALVGIAFAINEIAQSF